VACLQKWEGFTCIQQRHTYLEPAMRTNFGAQLILTPELEEYCRRKNLGIMAYSPLLGGAYDQRDRPIPVPYHSASTDVRMARLRAVADELGLSINNVVLAWMLQSSPRVIPLMAGSSVHQIKLNLDALSVCLTEKQSESLNRDIFPPEKY
jgi:aryl-alcohol dehydrogenase-like predicted oxidoreductase